MFQRLFCFVLVFVCLSFTGCGRNSGDTENIRITGFVCESSGGPVVAGSVITVDGTGLSARTGSDGSFFIDLPPGYYSFSTDKPGFVQSRIEGFNVSENGVRKLFITQPRVFCSEWDAKSPRVTVSGIKPGDTVNGTVDIEVKAEGAYPIASIKITLGNSTQEPLKYNSESNTLSCTWDASQLPDGENFLVVTAVDHNFNSVRYIIPIAIKNSIADDKVPSVVTGIEPFAYTYAACYDHDLRSADIGRKRGARSKAPADTTISTSMNWNVSEGARGYRIYRAESPDAEPVLIEEVFGGDSVRFRDFDPNLSEGMKLYYYISAFNNYGESEKTAAVPVEILERFTVNLKSPKADASGVNASKPVFEWEISKPVGDVQYYHLIVLGYTDGKGEFAWDAELSNTTSVQYDGELQPAKVYQWDIVNAYAGRDYVKKGLYRSMSFPGMIEKNPYSEEFSFVTSSNNGSFLFTTSTESVTDVSSAGLPENGKIIVRMLRGNKPSVISNEYGIKLLRTFCVGQMQYGVFQINTGRDSKALFRKICSDNRIAYAERAPVFKFDLKPDDPDYSSRQYCHIKMDSENAWNISTGSSDIVMAIIDTGLDGTHPEFLGRVVTGHNFSTGTDVPPGTHFDSYGHGTHVAGIAGATGDNAVGVAGVNWKSMIMPIKVNDEGDEVAEYVIESIPWAADHGAHVINMSLGSPGYSQALQDAINYACGKGVSVVVSMGNKGTRILQFPAGNQGVIAVGSSNGRDECSSFSSRGDYISVTAPGEEIFSTSNKDHSYIYSSGTSMSTPQVVGAIALLKSIHPDWTMEEVKSHLENTANDVDAAGYDIKTGWGRIDLFSLLTKPKTENKYARFRLMAKTVTNQPADGADVVLYNASGNTVTSVKTDQDGYAYFFCIPKGAYKASVRYGSGISITGDPIILNAGVNEDVVVVVK